MEYPITGGPVTIEYALTRTEVVQGFFRSVAASSKYRVTILVYAVGLVAIFLTSNAVFARTFSLRDFLIGLMQGIACLAFIPFWLFLRAKTTMRSLTTSPEGISTQIGSMNVRIPWQKVKVISETPRFVLVSRSNGNAFYIPNRAFTDPDQKTRFVDQLKQWSNANHPKT